MKHKHTHNNNNLSVLDCQDSFNPGVHVSPWGFNFRRSSGLSYSNNNVKKGYLSRTYDYEFVNILTGEYVKTTDYALRVKRKRKRIKTWAKLVSPLYAERKISVLFITLNYKNDSDFRKGQLRAFLNAYIQKLKYHGLEVLAYIWVLERGEKNGLLHYHIGLALNKRVYFEKLPDWIKPDKSRIWRYGHSRVEFVKYSVKRYLAGYLYKRLPCVPYSYVRLYDSSRLWTLRALCRRLVKRFKALFNRTFKEYEKYRKYWGFLVDVGLLDRLYIPP